MIQVLNKILAKNRRKAKELVPKKEIARYIIRLIKDGISDEQYKKMNEVLDDVIEKRDMNVIMRLLCKTYCCGINIDNNINLDTVKQKINDNKLAQKINQKIKQ